MLRCEVGLLTENECGRTDELLTGLSLAGRCLRLLGRQIGLVTKSRCGRTDELLTGSALAARCLRLLGRQIGLVTKGRCGRIHDLRSGSAGDGEALGFQGVPQAFQQGHGGGAVAVDAESSCREGNL